LISNIVAAATRSEVPFLIENRFGQGRCHYFPATVGELFEETKVEGYPRLLAEILGEAALPVRVSGVPHLLDVSLRRQPSRRRTLVHLTNLELGPIDQVVPAFRVRLEVQVDHAVGRATALRVDRPLRFRARAGRVSLTLPELSEYEVVALEA
jgi:hypothetical protein